MSTKRPANRGGESALAVSAWPLRRKVALALAVPLLLAGTLGGLRVQSDLVEASNSSSSAQQVTALRPAVDYLTAAEQAMVAAVGTDKDSQAALEEALADIRRAGSRRDTPARIAPPRRSGPVHVSRELRGAASPPRAPTAASPARGDG